MSRVLGVTAIALSLAAASCGVSDDNVELVADAHGEVIIDMDEFDFGADVIRVSAGETVTFVLVNEGRNEHEFMIGRNVVETDLGYPNGFEHDFFETMTPVVDPPSAGMDMGAMVMDDEMSAMDDDMGAMDDEMSAMDDDMSDMDHDMGAMDDEMSAMDDDMGGDVHSGFMVQRRPGEVARLTVTIADDAVGEWEIGCFRGRGAHWDAGMRARLVVTAA